MRRELLIAAGPGEWRALWAEDGAPAELHVERGDQAAAGSLHVGRVLRLVAGLDAALVDIGGERPAFLPLRRPAVEGERLFVQVQREARRDKAARLTTRLTEADLARHAEAGARMPAPAQLYPAPGFAAALALRLPAVPDRVLADEAAIVPELRRVFAYAEVAHCFPAEWPLDLEAAFDAALCPGLALPGEGRLHIEETRAAVLVDVDTGSPDTGSAARTATEVNLAAARTVARQLRLRQLGGAVLVDFAALEGAAPRRRVLQAMTEALLPDPARPQVLGWTRLGLLEIVRPRRLRSLSEAMLEPGGERKTPLTLAFEALRMLAREARARPAADWQLALAAPVEAALRGPAAAALRALETRLGRHIETTIAPGLPRGFDIRPR